MIFIILRFNFFNLQMAQMTQMGKFMNDVASGDIRVPDGKPGPGQVWPLPEHSGYGDFKPVPVPPEKMPFYKRSGWKRMVGIVSGVGGLLTLVPEPTCQVIGGCIGAIMGGYVYYVGRVDAKKRADEGKEVDSVWKAVLELVQLIYSYIKRRYKL